MAQVSRLEDKWGWSGPGAPESAMVIKWSSINELDKKCQIISKNHSWCMLLYEITAQEHLGHPGSTMVNLVARCNSKSERARKQISMHKHVQ